MGRTDEFLTVDGIEIHYAAWGEADAPPVVCVHGLSRVGRDFDSLARELQDTYRVLCPDMPGRGLSEWAADPDSEYTGTAMAALCVEFVDALGIEDFRWVGTSMGGSLGIELAGGELSDRITHLVLNDVGPAATDDEEAAEGVERIIEYLTNPPEVERLTELEAFYRETYATFSEMSDREWRAFTLTSSRRTEDGLFTPAYDTRMVRPFVTEPSPIAQWERWDAVHVPTLLLRGVESDILSDETAREMVERRPETAALEFDCGHAPSLNVPNQIEPIREHLAK